MARIKETFDSRAWFMLECDDHNCENRYDDSQWYAYENDLLADALNALPQDNRDILLMYWFLEMADREIAERMNLARRTINNRRLKSYRLLKELMGGDTDA